MSSFDNWTEGPEPRPSEEQRAAFARIVGASSDRDRDRAVRWRRIDLKRVIADRFGVNFHPRYVGKLLHKLGFSHIGPRPRHPAQDERIVEAFKTYGPRRSQGVVAVACGRFCKIAEGERRSWQAGDVQVT
jgi:transposase